MIHSNQIQYTLSNEGKNTVSTVTNLLSDSHDRLITPTIFSCLCRFSCSARRTTFLHGTAHDVKKTVQGKHELKSLGYNYKYCFRDKAKTQHVPLCGRLVQTFWVSLSGQ